MILGVGLVLAGVHIAAERRNGTLQIQRRRAAARICPLGQPQARLGNFELDAQSLAPR